MCLQCCGQFPCLPYYTCYNCRSFCCSTCAKETALLCPVDAELWWPVFALETEQCSQCHQELLRDTPALACDAGHVFCLPCVRRDRALSPIRLPPTPCEQLAEPQGLETPVLLCSPDGVRPQPWHGELPVRGPMFTCNGTLGQAVPTGMRSGAPPSRWARQSTEHVCDSCLDDVPDKVPANCSTYGLALCAHCCHRLLTARALMQPVVPPLSSVGMEDTADADDHVLPGAQTGHEGGGAVANSIAMELLAGPGRGLELVQAAPPLTPATLRTSTARCSSVSVKSPRGAFEQQKSDSRTCASCASNLGSDLHSLGCLRCGVEFCSHCAPGLVGPPEPVAHAPSYSANGHASSDCCALNFRRTTPHAMQQVHGRQAGRNLPDQGAVHHGVLPCGHICPDQKVAPSARERPRLSPCDDTLELGSPAAGNALLERGSRLGCLSRSSREHGDDVPPTACHVELVQVGKKLDCLAQRLQAIEDRVSTLHALLAGKHAKVPDAYLEDSATGASQGHPLQQEHRDAASTVEPPPLASSWPRAGEERPAQRPLPRSSDTCHNFPAQPQRLGAPPGGTHIHGRSAPPCTACGLACLHRRGHDVTGQQLRQPAPPPRCCSSARLGSSR